MVLMKATIILQVITDVHRGFWPACVNKLVVVYLSMDDEKELVESWKEAASFSSRSTGLLHPGVPRRTSIDVCPFSENHHSVRK